MADTELKDLTAATSVISTDLLYTLVDPAGTPLDRKITVSNFTASINGLVDHGTMVGLSDDDHAQYARLGGRSGGQLLFGGTAGSDSFYIYGSAGAGARIGDSLSAASKVACASIDGAKLGELLFDAVLFGGIHLDTALAGELFETTVVIAVPKLAPLGGHAFVRAALGGTVGVRTSMGGCVNAHPRVGGDACVRSALGGCVSIRAALGGCVGLRPGIGGHVHSRPVLGGIAGLRSRLGGTAAKRSCLGGRAHATAALGGRSRTRSQVGGLVGVGH